MWREGSELHGQQSSFHPLSVVNVHLCLLSGTATRYSRLMGEVRGGHVLTGAAIRRDSLLIHVVEMFQLGGRWGGGGRRSDLCVGWFDDDVCREAGRGLKLDVDRRKREFRCLC